MPFCDETLILFLKQCIFIDMLPFFKNYTSFLKVFSAVCRRDRAPYNRLLGPDLLFSSIPSQIRGTGNGTRNRKGTTDREWYIRQGIGRVTGSDRY